MSYGKDAHNALDIRERSGTNNVFTGNVPTYDVAAIFRAAISNSSGQVKHIVFPYQIYLT